MNDSFQVIHGDCIKVLKQLKAQGVKVQCCVTSPPYWGLRDYQTDGQLGLEETPQEFIDKMVEIFALVWDVLKDDGTLWLNLGDSYAQRSTGLAAMDDDRRGKIKESNRKTGNICKACGKNFRGRLKQRFCSAKCGGKDNTPRAAKGLLKAKDLVGMPWRVALALQDFGWYLRQDVIWNKPNPMPESAKDRCTKAHEYIFLLTKKPHYYYDQEAILEPCSPNTHARLSQDVMKQIGSQRAYGGKKTNGAMKATARKTPNGWANSPNYHDNNPMEKKREHKNLEERNENPAHSFNKARKGSGVGWGNTSRNDPSDTRKDRGRIKDNDSFDSALAIPPKLRNKRSVWTITTKGFKGSHFATFPKELPETCILAGSKIGDTILDPFSGAGTTGLVAIERRRKYIGIEINENYIRLSEERIKGLQIKIF